MRIVLTAELLSTLRNFAGVVLLDLGASSLLLGFQLKSPDVFSRLANLNSGGLEGAIGVMLSGLGIHDTLAGLDDRRVQLDAVAVAK